MREARTRTHPRFTAARDPRNAHSPSSRPSSTLHSGPTPVRYLNEHLSSLGLPTLRRISSSEGQNSMRRFMPTGGAATRRRPGLHALGAAAVTTALGLSVAGPVHAAPAAAGPFISEIHYDNARADSGEAIEIEAPAGSDLTGWQIVLYNGVNGAAYHTATLSGVVPAAGVVVQQYPANGIQNGAPDGVALVDPTGAVTEFL